jgi:hypothetical protein
MTTNRMGLEQTLSDEQLEELITELELCGIYGRQVRALAELQKFRKASKEPVADVVAWNKPGEERNCDIRWRRFDVAPGPLFAAPPLQAVTVPDGWQLVPTELTDVMRDAWDSAPNGEDNDLNMQNAYRAMIAAAPSIINEP